MTAVDRISSQRHGVADVVSVSGGNQRCGGIQQNYITAAGTLAIENCADDGGILLGIASGDVVQRCPLQTEILRRDLVRVHLTVANLGNFTGTGDGDFVQSIAWILSTMKFSCRDSFWLMSCWRKVLFFGVVVNAL